MGKLAKTVYADALFSLAQEKGCIQEWMEEVDGLEGILKEHPELFTLMSHPQIKKEEKKDLLNTLFEGRLSSELLGFLFLVLEKQHFQELPGMLEEYRESYRRYYRIGTVSVSSATELSGEQKQKIHDKLLATTSYETLETTYVVDASLLGGVVIRIGDRVVDGSIKNKLDRLTKQLRDAQLAENEKGG